MKVYLDNNATTPVDPRVIEAMLVALQKHFGNPASATHAWGWEAEALVEIAREAVASCIGAAKEEIVFTSGATEALGLAIQGLAAAGPKRMLCTTIEHKAVLDNLWLLKRKGFSIEFIPVDKEGCVDISTLEMLLKQPTRLTCIIGANNEIGTTQDLSAIGALCRKHNSLLLADLVQATGKIAFNVGALPVDLAAFSAHKIYGPKGCGALFIRRQVIPEIEPMLVGGGHERNLRSGTLNVPGIVGFGKAAALVKSELREIQLHLNTLTQRLLIKLRAEIPAIVLNGSSTSRIPGNLSLSLPKADAVKILSKLASSVALSASSACLSGSKTGSHVLKAIALTEAQQRSTIRLGIGRFNTVEEIDYAAERIVNAYRAATCVSA